MGGFNIQEILVILIVGLVLFGSNKLPEVGRGLGKAIRNFKRAASELDEIDITPTAKKNTKQDGPHEG